MPERRRIGLIVNPIAGIGGPLAARGSDNFRTVEEAERLGGKAIAAGRAERALRRLRALQPDVEIIAAAGQMGACVARATGFNTVVLDGPSAPISTAQDTQAAADAMRVRGAEIILFAGGDGTARDIFGIVADRLPLVGIPTGVKMHSAVFALSPEAAGETAAIAMRQPVGMRLAEIMDSDPSALADGRPSAHLFGYAATPALPRLFQPAKGARPDGGEAEIEALGRVLSRDAKPGRLLIFGPGTTMAAIKRAFGFAGTLIGVDAVVDGQVIAANADAATLAKLCGTHSETSLMVGIVGGQGFVFGRGNQQISPDVIRAALPHDFRIIATREKLLALPSSTLHVDTGDVDLDRTLEGYHRVETGPNDTVMMRLTAGFQVTA